MLKDSMMGLAMAVVVISSIAWVGQWRKIREKIRIRKAVHSQRAAPKTAH